MRSTVVRTPFASTLASITNIPSPIDQSSLPEKAEPGGERRWVHELLVLQVTSLFAAGLFIAVWLTH